MERLRSCQSEEAMPTTLAITLPEDDQKRKHVLKVLHTEGCITSDQLKLVEPVPETAKAPSKWARFAQKLSNQAAFNGGMGEHLRQARQELRDDFALRDPNQWRQP